MRGRSLKTFRTLIGVVLVATSLSACSRIPIISDLTRHEASDDHRYRGVRERVRDNASREAYEVTVRRNDTLSEIALRNGVPTRELANANGLRAPFTIHTGQTLTIPARPRHTVQRGESLSVIAQRYDLSTRDLARDNHIRRMDRIYAGQQLVLPWSATSSRPAATSSDSRTQVASNRNASASRTAPRARPERAAPTARRVTPTPVSNTSARDLTPPARSGQGFMWPVDGRVIADFGPAGDGRQNDGINIAVREGTPIRAADNGVVIYAGNEVPGFGNLVLIRHDDGFVTAYAHQQRINVRQGHEVERGEIIGLAGRTGRVTEAQVHFEVRRNSRAVNPAQFLAGA